jgi:methionine biosynthesis protein MetW
MSWIKKYFGESNVRVLDVGCGFGYFLKKCDEKQWETYGVDISEYAISEAETYTKAKLLLQNVENGLPTFGDEYFDLVVILDVIEHLHSPHVVLRECHRVLKPCGKLAVATPNLGAIERLFLKLRGKQNRWHGFYDETHIRLFTPTSLKLLTERIGFRTVELKTPFQPLPTFVSKILEKSNLGGKIWLLAEKY